MDPRHHKARQGFTDDVERDQTQQLALDPDRTFSRNLFRLNLNFADSSTSFPKPLPCTKLPLSAGGVLWWSCLEVILLGNLIYRIVLPWEGSSPSQSTAAGSRAQQLVAEQDLPLGKLEVVVGGLQRGAQVASVAWLGVPCSNPFPGALGS